MQLYSGYKYINHLYILSLYQYNIEKLKGIGLISAKYYMYNILIIVYEIEHRYWNYRTKCSQNKCCNIEIFF